MFPHAKQLHTGVISVLLLISAVPGKNQTRTRDLQTAASDQVVSAVCDKRVALLGEPPIHGFGNTLAFKMQLVRRLVGQCHYNALFFESGFYDYIHIQQQQRSGQVVPASMISAAIGGLRANKEVQALVPFLSDEIQAGRLTLGGLDDQIGAGSYASQDMSSDLVRSLPEQQRSRCLAILQRHLRWQYTQDAPYSLADKTNIVGCLNQLQTALSSTKQEGQFLEQTKAMLESLQRNIARTLVEDDFSHKDQELKWSNDRDRSMYLNFEWLRHHLPPQSKIIVWAATVHTANDLTSVEGFTDRVPLGSYIHNELNNQAFSLGFSAYSGEYAFTRQPIRRLSDAPPTSLESRVLTSTGSDVVYLSGTQLSTFGFISARPLGTDFTTAQWNRVVDGLVLFRTERAPAWINPQSR